GRPSTTTFWSFVNANNSQNVVVDAQGRACVEGEGALRNATTKTNKTTTRKPPADQLLQNPNRDMITIYKW
ncbi:hypothetical protein, partial [Pseudonocardia sp. TRM90224]|uniref:hypothetical protein n=1 Tax=Pseudonocardia sp. TRM90224 TaxID=2812678 RepID=UPI001E50E5A3